MRLEKVYYWPSWFYSALPAEDRKKISRQTLNNLERSQKCLWTALNIYDDFLDGSGQAKRLPLANAAYRRFLEIYYRANFSASFYQEFNRLSRLLDRANRQEAERNKLNLKDGAIAVLCSRPLFPDLKRLADKSLILAAGPLAILDKLGYRSKDQLTIATCRFFQFALAAKQLADDARDWLEDLTQGKITAVNILVIQGAQRRKIKLDLDNNLAPIFQLFSKYAALKTSQNIIKLCRAARQSGRLLKLPKNNGLICEILEPLEEAATKSLDFRKLLFKKS